MTGVQTCALPIYIVLLASPGAGPSRIDAEVRLHGSVAEGHAVWSEDVRLVVQGPLAGHLESLIEPLTLPDLPVAVWFVSGLPDPHDPLVLAATTVVVDGDTLADATSVAAMARLAARRVVFDLCWERLRPWRQLLAGAFEVPAARPFLAGVTRVEVEGPQWPSALLGGWAASRLGLPPSAIGRAPAATPAIRLVAEHGGQVATFVAEQAEGAGGTPVVRLVSSLASPGARPDRLSLPEDPTAWALGEVLTRSGRDRPGRSVRQAARFGAIPQGWSTGDRVQGQALQAAVALAGPPPQAEASAGPPAS